jgi:hypothetical protein
MPPAAAAARLRSGSLSPVLIGIVLLAALLVGFQLRGGDDAREPASMQAQQRGRVIEQAQQRYRTLDCMCGSEVRCVMSEQGGRGEVPVVLRRSCVGGWPAMQRWPRPGYLASKAPSETAGVYRNTHRTFGPYYDPRRPLAHLTAPMNAYETNIALPTEALLEQMRHAGRSSDFLYYSGEADQWGDWVLDDVEPFEHLLALNPSVSSINLWVGQAGVRAHCHYDGYHNFYAQVVGRKRFTLLPPTAWPVLRPYPFLHPSHAQCQTNISATTTDRAALARAGLVEIDLAPGDLLYLPPLYFHEVEAVRRTEQNVVVRRWLNSLS